LVICDICGETYNEKTYQIVVPVLRASFDKIECAERALQRELHKAKRPALEEALFEEVERLRVQLRELRGHAAEAGLSVPLASGEAAEGD
jgi:hypothetical protein